MSREKENQNRNSNDSLSLSKQITRQEKRRECNTTIDRRPRHEELHTLCKSDANIGVEGGHSDTVHMYYI